MKAFLESQLQSLRETLEVDAEARAEREGTVCVRRISVRGEHFGDTGDGGLRHKLVLLSHTCILLPAPP